MTVAFIGHRKIADTEILKKAVYCTAENLIVNDNATTFLFGSKSEFDTLCYDTVCELINIYLDIKRVYVRAEYEFISDDYKNYLLSLYVEVT